MVKLDINKVIKKTNKRTVNNIRLHILELITNIYIVFHKTTKSKSVFFKWKILCFILNEKFVMFSAISFQILEFGET